MRPKIKTGVIQTRFDVGAEVKKELFEISRLLGTDATQLIRAVLVQTRGQWRQLYIAQLKSQATAEEIEAAKKVAAARERQELADKAAGLSAEV